MRDKNVAKEASKSNLVWYAAYGSSLLLEVFMTYIKGGDLPNGGHCVGCVDHSEPLKMFPYTIARELYFAKVGARSNLAFVGKERVEDPQDLTLGRIYLITEAQFREIQKQKGARPEAFGLTIRLGELNGDPVLALTRDEDPGNFAQPAEDYLKAIMRGLRETYRLNDIAIADYLLAKPGVLGRYSREDLIIMSRNCQIN